MSEKALFNYVTRFADKTPVADLGGHSLLFTHIPKTAGTTFEYILRAVAMTRQIPVLRAMGTIYGQFHGPGKPDAMSEFSRFPAAAFEKQIYLSGHVPHGAHTRLSRPYFYITMLRDPVARLISQYRFGVQRGGWTAATPIGDVVRQGLMADNLQTRMLAGIQDRSVACTREALDTAIERLRSEYAVIGIAERFDQFLKVLITLLGWPDVAYGNRQVTTVARNEVLAEQANDAARRFLAYDLELYTAACELADPATSRLFRSDSQTGRTQRGDDVVVCIPGTPIDGTSRALMSAESFDRQFLPALRAHGGDIRVV